MESQASTEGPQRRRLNLKPRDESAASKAETERKSARSVSVLAAYCAKTMASEYTRQTKSRDVVIETAMRYICV